MTIIKRSMICSSVVSLALILCQHTEAQEYYYWQSSASNGNWNQVGHWVISPGGVTTEIPGHGTYLAFNNNTQLSMTNDLAATVRFRINFLNGSGARIINGTTANTFVQVNGATPQIDNNTGYTQTINFKIINNNVMGSRLVLDADSTANGLVGSDLVFGGDVSAMGGSGLVTAVAGSGNVTINGRVMEEEGAIHSLTREGPGTLLLTGTAANTYSGTTTVVGGTLALGKTNNVTAVSGIRLIVKKSGRVVRWDANNQVADTTLVTLNGGKLALSNGDQEGTATKPGVGELTVQSNSVIDLSGSGNILHFAASNLESWSGTLAIWNWDGTPLVGGGLEQLSFGTGTSGLTQAQLNAISFYSDSGSTFLGTAMFASVNGFNGEIVAVPDPATWIGAF